ncbi:hypothetical protein V2J09_010057 [Rumex salicifolius]
MQSLCLTTARFGSKPSLSPVAAQLSCNRRFLDHRHGSDLTSVAASLDSASVFSPLRISSKPSQGLGLVIDKKKKRGSSGVCRASITFHPRTIQWISVVSAAILMLTKGTAISKSYLVPLFALQAPASVISWMRGEYGIWSAFLALLVRLFFFIPGKKWSTSTKAILFPNIDLLQSLQKPYVVWIQGTYLFTDMMPLFLCSGELELPFMTLLLVIVAPYQAMNFRGTQPGNIISLAIAAYLAFQHFSREGSLKKAFSQGGLVASSAIMLITAVSNTRNRKIKDSHMISYSYNHELSSDAGSAKTRETLQSCIEHTELLASVEYLLGITVMSGLL